ncbi:GIY-YIG nuclease family protein [Stenotrophomonas sp. TWI143]|jgi:putative endonuclease|uniref:Nuclease n=2 Tax=Stenotrophomonas maltophilia TaxID=40324 RepID=A0AAP7L232_STEMA|nr:MULTISPECIES: GIY-YIG nuclease family protein [Stenotrophomonas]KOQ71500.1 nuclease [Stenotrophomonas maltophilia]MCU1093309.1 GIY-YIG nuclease family protein [Stenotrophomonas maltophilia]MDZ5840556.1 GIY-YIG nuclease family protein [Stenotrophomonas maltophilia]OBU51674.1 nuclease [Stenotrophomonas maltophilia]OBU62969.1 nuclease [Stenotrophomonas maltophilia]
MAPSHRPWFLYLLECRDGSYYAGISTDVDARFAAHRAGTGARYTRARPPLRILAVREYPDRSAASRAEWQLKQLPRERKLAWLQALDSASL